MGSSSNFAGAIALGVRHDLMVDNKRGIRNGGMGKDQVLGSSTANDSRSDQARGVIRVHSDQQKTRKLQGQVIRWEKFFPSGSLRVLLVENDDSTRHVLSALIRNCSYEVIAVADGFHALKILEDETTHVDLVLTEVVMPFISGVGLLSKIMSHQCFKNIPVIMMSSHDSMGIVLKCLSKGAADFLVKPIRKNELKNIWQHVWRRCRSSTGSVSACGKRIKIPIKSKNDAGYESSTDSSIERENESIGFSIQDESDDGNDAQSSWREKAAEVVCPQLKSCEQTVDAPESTRAQVLQTKLEIASNTWVCDIERNEDQE